MPLNRLGAVLLQSLETLEQEGRRKGHETVVVGVLPPQGDRGPRYLLQGYGDKPFIRMNFQQLPGAIQTSGPQKS